MDQAQLFLSNLFGEESENWFYLWDLPGKKSRWFQRADQAAKATESLKGHNVYVGASLAAEPLGESSRVASDQSAGIVGFWGDFDVADAVHKKHNLPPTIADALGMIEAVGIKPTVTVHSGHGLQPWWLFKESWIFDSEPERRKAAALIEALSATFKRKAKDRGWEVDSVHDLARVLRVPGTVNHKAEPVPVTILEADWSRRYDPSEFEIFNVDEIKIPKPRYICGTLFLDPGASPPFDKMEALLENSAEFRRTWDHKRDRELASCSEYDMALAHYAVSAMWTDQEVANLLIYHRRKYKGESLAKVTERADYVANTIAAARGDRDRDQAIRILAGAIDEETKPDDGDVPKDEKDIHLERISKVFGLRISRWVQLGKERPIYSLVLSNGQSIKVGGVADVVSLKAFEKAIYAATGHVIPPIPKKARTGVLETLSKVVEVIDASDVSDAEAIRSGIEAYLVAKDVYKAEQKHLACAEKMPFLEDNMIHVHADHFRKWLNNSGTDRWEKTDLVHAMRHLGFDRMTVSFRTSTGTSSRSYYATQTAQLATHTLETIGGEAEKAAPV